MLIMAFITAALIFKLCLLDLWYYLDDLTKKKGKFLKTLGTSYITMVPVVCPCSDSDRWRNIYSLKLQMTSSQKTTFSSLTWDHNICKVTKSCTILWTLVLWLLCSVGEFIRLFWNSDGTTDIARCFVFGTPNERQKVRVFERSSVQVSWRNLRHILLHKHAKITLLTRFCFSVLGQIVNHFWHQSFVITYLLRDWNLYLSTDFSWIREPVFIH